MSDEIDIEYRIERIHVNTYAKNSIPLVCIQKDAVGITIHYNGPFDYDIFYLVPIKRDSNV